MVKVLCLRQSRVLFILPLYCEGCLMELESIPYPSQGFILPLYDKHHSTGGINRKFIHRVKADYNKPLYDPCITDRVGFEPTYRTLRTFPPAYSASVNRRGEFHPSKFLINRNAQLTININRYCRVFALNRNNHAVHNLYREGKCCGIQFRIDWNNPTFLIETHNPSSGAVL